MVIEVRKHLFGLSRNESATFSVTRPRVTFDREHFLQVGPILAASPLCQTCGSNVVLTHLAAFLEKECPAHRVANSAKACSILLLASSAIGLRPSFRAMPSISMGSCAPT